MKKYLLNVKNVMLFLICVLCSLPLVAQDAVTEDKGKPNVFIDYFSGPRGIPFAWIESLRNSVISGINETGRVALIDVDSRSALAIEKERRESGEVVAGDEFGRWLGEIGDCRVSSVAAYNDDIYENQEELLEAYYDQHDDEYEGWDDKEIDADIIERTKHLWHKVILVNVDPPDSTYKWEDKS